MKYCLPAQASWWAGEGEPDGLQVLQPGDDVAAKKLGGRWRMPTDKEVNALIATLYKSQVAWDFHAQSIFLPYSGRMDGNKLEFAGIRGFFWSSTASKGATGGPDGAFNLGIDINDEGAGLWSNSRCYGFPIRPVYVME